MSEMVARLRAAGCVFAEEEAALIAARFPSRADRDSAVGRRCAGTPLELVLGEAAFAGVTVVVTPGVFLPRLRAEVLLDVADAFGRRCRSDEANEPADGQRSQDGGHTIGEYCLTALDLGCGTGAIAAALCSRHPTWDVHASDVDASAVACARVNGERFGFRVHRSDWLDGLPAALHGRFDLIVAHLPYVPTPDLAFLPRDYRAAEPAASVDGGADGLDPWRAVALQSDRWLAPGGWLLTQVTAAQQAGAVAIAAKAGLLPRSMEYADSVVIAASGPAAR